MFFFLVKVEIFHLLIFYGAQIFGNVWKIIGIFLY